MQIILLNILSFVVSTFLGLVASVVFEDKLKKYFEKLVNFIRYTIRFINGQGNIPDNFDFEAGNWKVAWVQVEGAIREHYKPSDIKVFYDQTELELNDKEMSKRIEEIEEEEFKKKDLGLKSYFNGDTVALKKITRAQDGPTEKLSMHLHVQKSKYFNFLAGVGRLDEEFYDENLKTNTTLRKKYIIGTTFHSPVPQLATSFAVQMALLTKDNYLVITKRSDDVVGYPNHLAPALNECIHPLKDYANGKLDLARTVIRAAHDEFNLDIVEDEIKFVSVGVDRKEYMYTLTGLIDCKKITSSDLISRFSTQGSESWEVGKIELLGPTLEAAVKKMSELSKFEMWSPYGVVCAIQALVYKASGDLTMVENYLRKYPNYNGKYKTVDTEI